MCPTRFHQLRLDRVALREALAREKGATPAQLAPGATAAPAAATEGDTIPRAFAEQKWVEREQSHDAARAQALDDVRDPAASPLSALILK